jgi:chloramphenicol 3-O phosphotransferase
MTPVIVLNGGSSSGKSSIARALQEVLPGTWLTFGVDDLVDALPGRGRDPRSGLVFEPNGTVTVRPEFRTLEDAWYAGLASMARAGARLILDEVLLAGAAGQQRLRAAFGDLEVLWVGVHCDPTVAAAREASRPDRVGGMAMAQAVSVHAGMAYDVDVDTTDLSASLCAGWIAERMS